MIKIIERHEYPVPEYRFTCEKCRSVADITIDEIKYEGVQWDYYYEFKCPVCGKIYSAYNSAAVLNQRAFKRLGD